MESSRTGSSSTLEDARHALHEHPPVDDCIKVYGAYHSIRPFRPTCGEEDEKRGFSWFAEQLFPCIRWLKKYHGRYLEQDIIAGITVGLTIVPQAIAYASIASLPLQYGLYSSFMAAFVYVFFGTAKDVSLGPTTVMAILVAEKVAQYPPSEAAIIAVLLTFYTGCLQIAMGVFRLGFLVDFISLSVTKGFIAAASVIIAAEQLKGLLGLTISTDSFIWIIYETFANIKKTNYWDLIMGLGCAIIILLLKFISPKRGFIRALWYDRMAFQILRFVCNARYAIAVCVAGSIQAVLLSRNIHVLSVPENVKAGLPDVRVPDFQFGNMTAWQSFKSLGSSLLVFPLLSLLELATIAKSFAQEYGYVVYSSQEFRAVGIANLVSSFFSSFPITASFSRSALNAQCRVRTPAAGLLTGAVAILATAFLTPWLTYIPKASLSAVIICAVLPNIDFAAANHMWKTRRGDLFPYFVTILSCFLLGIEVGVLIGVFVSVALILFPIARPTVAVYNHGLEIIVTPYGNLHFPAMNYMRKLIVRHMEKCDSPGKIVIDGSHWTDLDYTVAARMTDLIHEITKKGWELSFSGMSDMVSGTFEVPAPRRRRTDSENSIIISPSAPSA